MSNPIIDMLYAQTINKVQKEMAVESEKRLKEYLIKSMSVLIKEKLLTPEQCVSAVKVYGIEISAASLVYQSGLSDYYEEREYSKPVGCGAMTDPNPRGGNRC